MLLPSTNSLFNNLNGEEANESCNPQEAFTTGINILNNINCKNLDNVFPQKIKF